jgi:hypothetical protein
MSMLRLWSGCWNSDSLLRRIEPLIRDMEAGFLEVARLNPVSVMVKQVNVFAIEVEG